MATSDQLLIGFVTTGFSALGGYIYHSEKRNRKKEKEAEERTAQERKEMREQHAEERKELLELHKQQFRHLAKITEDSNKVGSEQNKLLAQLKTLFENK